MTRTMVALALSSMLSMAIAACTASTDGPARFPTPTSGKLDPENKARIIQARTAGIHTLTAVLTIAFSHVDRRGTFEMIVNYDDAGHLRFSAFKDLLVSSRPVFDLLFTDARYRLEVYNAGQVQRDRGDTSQFVQKHPQFQSFYTIGEGFFLPGFDARGNLPVPANRTAAEFVTRLKSGAVAHWFTETETLEITSARIATFAIQYGDYRQVGPFDIPGLVVLKDTSQKTTSRGVLKHVDINIPLAPGVFDMSMNAGRLWFARDATGRYD